MVYHSGTGSASQIQFAIPPPLTIDIGSERLEILDQVVESQTELMVRHKNKQEWKCYQSFACTYEDYKNIHPMRAPGTCQWALDHDHFRAWQQSSHNDILWISADPGYGKSVLSRFLVDHGIQNARQTTVYCYFFFKDNEHQNNLAMALKSLLFQLFSHQPHLLRYAVPVWAEKDNQVQYEVKDMWRIFLAATADATAGTTICVLDALDDCRDEDRRRLVTSLGDLYRSYFDSNRKTPTTHLGGRLKILVTSRPYDSVQRLLNQITPKVPQIQLRDGDENHAFREEMDLVVNQQVSELATRFLLSDENQQLLLRRLLEMEHLTYPALLLAMGQISQTYHSSPYPNKVQIDSLQISIDRKDVTSRPELHTDSGYASLKREKCPPVEADSHPSLQILSETNQSSTWETQTIYSNSASVETSKRDGFIQDFAELLFQDIGGPQLDMEATSMLCNDIEELLADFAIRLGQESPSTELRGAMVFIYKHRRLV